MRFRNQNKFLRFMPATNTEQPFWNNTHNQDSKTIPTTAFLSFRAIPNQLHSFLFTYTQCTRCLLPSLSCILSRPCVCFLRPLQPLFTFFSFVHFLRPSFSSFFVFPVLWSIVDLRRLFSCSYSLFHATTAASLFYNWHYPPSFMNYSADR